LVESLFAATATEARLRGTHQALTPVVDVARDPRWGRVEETYGEDPYLVSRMGIAAVRGFQGDATFRGKKHIVFSAIVFGLKAGLGFGGAIGGWLLSLCGYVPNQSQTAQALLGIRLTVSVFPAVTFLIGVVCLFFYKIDKQLNIRVTDELAERRKKYAVAGTS